MMRQTSDVPRVCFDDSQVFCQNSVFLIYSDSVALRYLLSILNSRLLRFVYRFLNPQLGKTFAEIKPSAIKQLPIRTIDFSNKSDKAAHDRMVKLVDRMLDLHKKLATAKSPLDKERIPRNIEATDRKIDKLVYDLYGLTEDEIRIVEEATSDTE